MGGTPRNDLDGKQNIMTTKKLATLRHGNPRRSIVRDYWAPLRSITQGLQTQMGEHIEDLEVVRIIMNALDNDHRQTLFQIMTPEPNADQKDIYIRQTPMDQSHTPSPKMGQRS